MAIVFHGTGCEVNGIELFPELGGRVCGPGGQYRSFKKTMKKLERDVQQETAAEEAAKLVEEATRLKKQKAKEEEGEFYLSDEEEYFSDPKLMAKVAGSQTTGLVELPPEILTMITEYCCPDPHPSCRESRLPANLISLRLSHPAFANLQLVKQKLFRNYTLNPDPGSLWMIERAAEHIAQFVHTVRMRPVIIDRAKARLSYKGFGPTATKVKEDLRPRIKQAIDNGRAHSAWVKFLAKTKEGVRVFIEYRENEDDPANMLTCPGPPPQPFLQLATAALAASRCKITELDVQFSSRSVHVWENISSWTKLSLSDMHSLRLSMSLDKSRRTCADQATLTQQFSDESARVLQCLMERSSLSLRSVDFHLNVNAEFSCSNLPVLHGLRSLTIKGGLKIQATGLGSWMAAQDKLSYVCLSPQSVTAGPRASLDDWKPFFDAIKGHPGNPFLYLARLSIITSSGVELFFTLRHRLGTPSHGLSENSLGSHECSKVVSMLQNYLSSTGEWDTFGLLPRSRQGKRA